MDEFRSRGKLAVTARVVAAIGVTVGAVAWINVMTRMNPGSAWFWNHDSSLTLYKSLETLFLVGVAAVAAHVATLVLILQLTSRRAGLWLGQAALTGIAGMSGLALYAFSANPRLLFATPVLVPVVADGLAVVLIGVAWWISQLRQSNQDTLMWLESTNLEWFEAATVVVPLGIVLMLTGGWLNVVFDESMGPEDGGVVAWALFISLSALVWAQILVAVSRRRIRKQRNADTAPKEAQ
ncbi:MAG TPA: hypothetical protein H9902_01785 [Candidatus Stackebrandtia faecavium]|nr:hypothetical protein [Candidatus Stackebrandtia faecavium]